MTGGAHLGRIRSRSQLYATVRVSPLTSRNGPSLFVAVRIGRICKQGSAVRVRSSPHVDQGRERPNDRTAGNPDTEAHRTPETRGRVEERKGPTAQMNLPDMRIGIVSTYVMPLCEYVTLIASTWNTPTCTPPNVNSMNRLQYGQERLERAIVFDGAQLNGPTGHPLALNTPEIGAISGTVGARSFAQLKDLAALRRRVLFSLSSLTDSTTRLWDDRLRRSIPKEMTFLTGIGLRISIRALPEVPVPVSRLRALPTWTWLTVASVPSTIALAVAPAIGIITRRTFAILHLGRTRYVTLLFVRPPT
jgi:hypothetical protein